MLPVKIYLFAVFNFLWLSSLNAQVKPIDWQGHRGCRGLYPENTIKAMIKAIDLGVTTLEMDVVITKDKQVVLSHEPFMNAEISTTPEGVFLEPSQEKANNIYQMDYVDVQKWDVGLKPHPRFPQQLKIALTKPLLSDVTDAVEEYTRANKLPSVYYNIETKSEPAGDDTYHPKPAEFVALLMAVCKQKGINDRLIVQSFDPRTLQIVHHNYQGIQTAFLVESTSTRTMHKQLNALGFKPNIFSPAYSFANKKLIEMCHRQGMKVIVWTVNTREDIKRMLGLGVDGIISDYPNLFNSFNPTSPQN